MQDLKRQVLDLRDRVLSAEQRRNSEAASQALHSLSQTRQSRSHVPAPQYAPSEQVAVTAIADNAGTLELQRLLMATTVKLQHKESQARKYKEGVRALKARLSDAEVALNQRQAQIATTQAELVQLRSVVQGMSGPAAAASAELQEIQSQLIQR